MMDVIADIRRNGDRGLKFDVLVAILTEIVKLLDHADSSSGAAGEVADSCLTGIEALCLSAIEEEQGMILDTILKTVKRKPFQMWQDYGYGLLKAAVPLVQDKKQMKKVYSLLEHLGPSYAGIQHPDACVIIYRPAEGATGGGGRAERSKLWAKQLERIYTLTGN